MNLDFTLVSGNIQDIIRTVDEQDRKTVVVTLDNEYVFDYAEQSADDSITFIIETTGANVYLRADIDIDLYMFTVTSPTPNTVQFVFETMK